MDRVRDIFGKRKLENKKIWAKNLLLFFRILLNRIIFRGKPSGMPGMARKEWARTRPSRSMWTSPTSSRRNTGSVGRMGDLSFDIFYFFIKFYTSINFDAFKLLINLEIIVLVVLLRDVGLSDHVEGAFTSFLGRVVFIVII